MEKQQTESTSKKKSSMGYSMQECIQNCITCFKVCEENRETIQSLYFYLRPV